jgi:hypothetical protein
MSPLARLIVCLSVISLFASTRPAVADVQVSIATDLETGRHFLVDTYIFYGGIHGSHAKLLDRSFLSAGEEKRITVLAVVPFFYGSIVTGAQHPAYYHGDTVRSDKMPFALRTITLEKMTPVSWRSLLDRGTPLTASGVGIRAGDVNNHFSMILRQYLPAFDRARVQEDLRQHLPLLREMAAFAHSEQALKNSKFGMARGSSNPGQYDEAVERTDADYRRQLVQHLGEIEGWLALPQEKRRPMHDWVENAHKAEYVYREMMDESDRQQILRLLEQSQQSNPQRTVAWTNANTGVRYTFHLNTGTVSKDRSGYRTDLAVDLNPLRGVNDDQWYRRRSHPNFSRGKDGVWRMQ